MIVKTATRHPTPASWLGLLLASTGLAVAADFSLLSSAIVTTPAVVSTNTPARFTLHHVKLTPPPQNAPSLDGGLTPVGVSRFTLTSSAGGIVLVQQPQLPQLYLQGRADGWELVWSDPPLLEGLILESAGALTARTWQPVDVELTATGRRSVIPASLPGSPVRFYRLRKL